MRRIRKVIAIGLSVIMLAQGSLAFGAGAGGETDGIAGFVTRQGDKLIENGEEFRFISANAPTLTFVEDMHWHLPDPWEQEDALRTLAQMGATATRTYTLSVRKESDYSGQIRHVEGPGVFNEQAFVALDKAIELAHRHGVRLIIPFVDQYEWWGGITSYAAFRGKSQDAFWSDPLLIADFKATIDYVLNRTNTFTGVKYKDDPAILAWETGNELVPKAAGWTSMIAEYIKSIDPNHLVVDGRYGIDDASLTDDAVDIVSNHYYPNHYPNYTLQVNLDRQKSAGKKPLIIGEFGFVPTDQMDAMLDAIVENGTTGAMLWSLRYRNKDGGFYPHTESTYNGVFYGSYRWPGFPSGEGFDETEALRSLSDHAYEIRGLSNPGLPVPEAPELLPIDSVSWISWRGSVGARAYTVERADSPDGEWTVLSAESYDAVATNDQLFSDTTAVTGQTYYYRVKATNETGESAYSTVGPVTARHAILDEMVNYANMFEYSTDLKWDPDNPEGYHGDGNRLRTLPGATEPQYIGYALPSSPGNPESVKALSLLAETYGNGSQGEDEFVFETSADGILYEPLQTEQSVQDGDVRQISYTADSLPANARFFRIWFPAGNVGASIGHVAIGYEHTAGDELSFPEPRTKALVENGVLLDDLNHMLKMDSHTPNLSFLNDQPQYFGGDAKRLIQTANTPESFVYRTGGDMNYVKLLAYMRQDPNAYIVPDFKVFTSADGVGFHEYGQLVKTVAVGEGWWARTEYIAYSLPAGTRYLKVEFPMLPAGHESDAWNPQVSRITIGVGSEKLDPPAQGGKSLVIEDFEGYSGSNSALRDAYIVNSGGAPITMTLDGSRKHGGNFGLKLDAAFTAATGWGGIEKPLADADWSGASGIRFWVDPNGVQEGMTIQFNESAATGGEVWKAALRVSGAEPYIAELPFTQFAVADWWSGSHPEAGNGKIDLGGIAVFSLYVDGAEPQTIYVDSFELYKSPTIDDFEGYDGDNAKLQQAYSRNADGDDIVPELSAEAAADGQFGMAMNYELTDAKGFAGLLKELGGVDWTGNNGISLSLRSEDAGRGVTVQIKETSGEYWETKFTVGADAREGTRLSLPFHTFRRPGWAASVNGVLDLGGVDGIAFYVDKGSLPAGSGSIGLDKLEVGAFASIDNFELYQGSSGLLAGAYAPSGSGDAIAAAVETVEKAEGNYGLKLDYTLTDEHGYAGVTKELSGMNWSSSGNAISIWMKKGQADHQVMLQFAETDGDLWEAVAGGTGAGRVDIPFAAFKRNAQWSTGDGRQSLAGIAELSIFVNKGGGTAGSGTIYVDDIRLASIPELDEFEHYDGSDLVASGIYVSNPWGGTVRMTPDAAHKESGRFGVKYDYSLPAADKNFAGATKTLGRMDWSGGEGLRFWLAPDASNHKLVIQFKEPDGETWEAYVALTGSEPSVIHKPFSEFVHAPWNTNGNGTLDLATISEFSLYVNQEGGALGDSTLYFDGIRLYGAGEGPDPGDGDPGDPEDPEDPGDGEPDHGSVPVAAAPQATGEGVSLPAGSIHASSAGGKGIAAVTVDTGVLRQALDLALTLPEEKRTVLIPVQGGEDGMEMILPAAVFQPEWSGVSFLMTMDGIGYRLSVSLIDAGRLADRLGVGAEELRIRFEMKAANSDADDSLVRETNEALGNIGASLASAVAEFGLFAEANGVEVAIDDFGNTYTTRTFKASGNANASELTAFSYDPATGDILFVPAVIGADGDKTIVTMQRNGNSIYGVAQYRAKFTDMEAYPWAKDAIQKLANKLVVNGTPGESFEPGRTVTRAEFAAMLVRGLGLSGDAEAAMETFGDIGADDWFAGAAGKAAEIGIAGGYPDGTFRGNMAITREQMAVMADRALAWLSGGAHAAERSSAVRFEDADRISDWAEESVSRLAERGLLQGDEKGAFRPDGLATRAQAAVLLERLLKGIGFIN